MMVQIKLHQLFAAVLAFVLLTCFALSVSAQQMNPNNLPPCPKDLSATYHNCFGEVKSLQGDGYVGEFKNDKYHGIGTYIFSNGDTYFGDFREGEISGSGFATYANGDTYVGEFKDSTQDGLGRATYANGDTFIGEFKNGRKHGQGVINKGKHGEIEGIFENDQLVRKARAVKSKSMLENSLSVFSKGAYRVKIDVKTKLPQTIYFSFEIEPNGECDIGNIGCAKDIEFFALKTKAGYQINHFDEIFKDQCVIDIHIFHNKLKIFYRTGICKTGHGNRFVLERLNGIYILR